MTFNYKVFLVNVIRKEHLKPSLLMMTMLMMDDDEAKQSNNNNLSSFKHLYSKAINYC